MRRILFICLLFAMASAFAAPDVWNVKPAKTFFKGSGSYSDPYVISTVEEFALMAAYATDSAKRGLSYSLQTDIEINSGNAAEWGKTPPKYRWIPLGDTAATAYANLYGNGHTISGLYVNSDEDFQGLFGLLRGSVQDLNIVNSFIKGRDSVGAVVGAVLGEVRNVFVDAIVEGRYVVGGVLGCPYIEQFGEDHGGVSHAVFKGSVKGESYVGGIYGIGNASYSEAEGASYCDNYGSVVGTGRGVGGIAGAFYIDVAGAYLYKLRNFGSVSGGEYVGGIMGLLSLDRDPSNDSNPFDFQFLRNMGEIFGVTSVGGLFGEYYTGRSKGSHAIKYSYNAGRVKGMHYVDPLFYHSKWHAGYENIETCEKCYNFAEAYLGDVVLADDRKTQAEIHAYADSLGAEFIPDTGAVPLNGGYPILIGEDKNFGYLKGSGDEDDPYLISSMRDLMVFGKHAGAISAYYYKQTADIAYDTSYNWVPATLKQVHYDGGGHKISNFKSVWSTSCAGFIDSVLYKNMFVVKNLEFENVTVRGNDAAGALACRGYEVDFSNIKVSGKVVAEYNSEYFGDHNTAGGIVGRIHGGMLTNIENHADVEAPEAAGGILGSALYWNSSVGLKNISNYGKVKSGHYAGGISGFGGRFLFAKNYGDVHGSYAGGIAGITAVVSRSFNRGDIRGETAAAGIAAYAKRLSSVYSTGKVRVDSTKFGGMVLVSGYDYREDSLAHVDHAYYEKKDGKYGLVGPVNSAIVISDTAGYTQKEFLSKDVVKKMGEYFAYDEDNVNDGYPVFTTGFKGEGTAASPFLIASKDDMLRFSSFMNDSALNIFYADKFYRLTKDIVFDKSDSWKPVGMRYTFFSGEFDGGFHTISGLDMDLSDKVKGTASVFGFVSGTIKNLGVVNSVFAADTAAALVASLYGGVVSDCWNRNSKVTGTSYAGGLVAAADNNFKIDRSFNTGTVDGERSIGGIVGYIGNSISNVVISNSFNVGHVTVRGFDNGSISSLIGYDEVPKQVTLEKVYTTSTVEAKSSFWYSYSEEFGKNIFYLKGDSTDKAGYTEKFMKSKKFVKLLGPEFVYDSTGVNDGYPILSGSAALYRRIIKDAPKVVAEAVPFKVAAGLRTISLSGLVESERVAVADIRGRIVWKGRTAGNELSVHVNRPGIYIVKTGSAAAKIAVK